MDMNVTMNVAANELTAVLEAMDPEILAGGIYALVGVFAAVFAVFTTIGLLRYLLRAIGYAKMYHKAGEAPWKAFIPVYNTYTNYHLSWDAKFFFLYAALAVVSPVLGLYTEGFMALVSMAASIGLLYVIVKQNINMAKLFGKGVGTGIALVFFPGITSLILGLGKAEFQKAELQAETTENN